MGKKVRDDSKIGRRRWKRHQRGEPGRESLDGSFSASILCVSHLVLIYFPASLKLIELLLACCFKLLVFPFLMEESDASKLIRAVLFLGWWWRNFLDGIDYALTSKWVRAALFLIWMNPHLTIRVNPISLNPRMVQYQHLNLLKISNKR